MTMTQRPRRRTAVLAGALAAVALAGACGDPATQAGATSLRDALGLDGSDFREREAKVQEAVRRCMDEEGFDYVPMDPSAMNVEVHAPGSDDNAEFRRTKGYGITTTFGDRPESEAGSQGSDPNQAIRDARSDEDKAAYDKALFGSAANAAGEGDFAVRIGPGPGGGGPEEATAAPDLSEAGCFGRAQESVGESDKVQELGPKLQELEERISSDPRMVKADTAWAACMSDGGFDFEKPDDVQPYLFDKLQALLGDGDGGGPDSSQAPGAITFGGPPPDSPELAALQQEELALAKADDACSEKTGRRETTRKVRAEAEKQFLADNPGLGGDDAGGKD